jgi:transposase-like protein
MRRHISKAEKELALQMSLNSGLTDAQIAEYTGIRPRTIEALSAYQVHGQWPLGDLLDGNEFLIILPVSNSVSPVQHEEKSDVFL